MNNSKLKATLFFSLAFPVIVNADTQQLLAGDISTAPDETKVFSLEGENRDNIVGGTLTLGTEKFVIEKVSIHSLVGARNNAENTAKFAIFSSSYSDQVATGKPWIAATASHHCDEPYNSFLAIYTITDNKKLKRLKKAPYPALVDSTDASDQSVVYCFMAKPPV